MSQQKKKSSDLNQEVTQGGQAIQAGRDVVVYNGLTLAEAKAIAIDVFKEHGRALAAEAVTTATARATEVTEAFFAKLVEVHPAGIGVANDPGFQFALSTVQKEYARCGDKDLGDLLVDLLVDRTKLENRDIRQIVVDEALGTAPKLTESQLATLAVIFVFKYTQNHGVLSHEALGNYFDKMVKPFVEHLVKNQACFQHLEYAGCGSVGFSIGKSVLQTILGITYLGLFTKGFPPLEIEERGLSEPKFETYFTPCLNDASLMQVNARRTEDLDKRMEADEFPELDRISLRALIELNKMTDEEIRALCCKIRPYMEKLFDTWSDSSMNRFTLTSVGIAIGHANVKRFVGEFADLTIWIN